MKYTHIIKLFLYFVALSNCHAIGPYNYLNELPDNQRDIDTVCFNDGYGNGTKCICPNKLISGDLCESFNCINYGNKPLRLTLLNDNGYCKCLPGLWGTHCEPVNCVGNIKTDIEPKNNQFAVLLTFNKIVFFQNKAVDQILDTITQLFNPVNPASKNYQSGYFVITSITENSIIKELPYSLNERKYNNTYKNFITSLQSLLEADFEKVAGKQLYLADILTLVKNVNYGGDIYIVTNLGITDKAPSSDNLSQKIKEIALAKKVRIHIFPISQADSSKSIFYLDAYKPLLNFASTTGGLVVNPYNQIGLVPPVGNSTSQCLEKLVPILNNGRTIYRYSGPITSANSLQRFFLDEDSTSKSCTGYLSISSIRPLSIALTNQSFPTTDISQIIVNLTNIQIYKFNIVNCLPAVKIVLILPVPSDITQIFDIQAFSSTKRLSAEIGYTMDKMAEASSTLPILDIPNFVVATIKGILNESVVTISSSFSTNAGSFNPNVTERSDCYKNIQFGTINSEAPESGFFSIKVKSQGYQEWIPFTFINDNSYITEPSNSFSLKKTLTNKLAVATTTSSFCTTIPTISPAEINARGKTFSMAIYKSRTIFETLFDRPDNLSFMVNILQYLTQNSHYFSNYIAKVFTGIYQGTLQGSTSVNTPIDFMSYIMTEESLARSDTVCSVYNYVQTTLIDILSKPQFNTNSDLYIVTDQLYGFDPIDQTKSNETLFRLINEKQPRINLLLLTQTCQKSFLDSNNPALTDYLKITQRTGGSFVRIANDQDILDWFSFLKAQYLESYEIIYQESTNTDYINQKKTSTSFLLKANHRYTVWGTLRTKLTKFFPTSIDLFNSQGVSTNLPIDKRIGEEFSISINDLITADDQYSVAFNTDQIESYSFQIRVLEFNATFGYSLSFGDKFEKSPIHGTPAIIHANILEYNAAQITEAPQKITIYDSTYKQVYTNLLTPSCEKNVYSTQDTWQCSNTDQIYYIKIDTQEESRTFTVTCLQSDNGNPGSGSCLHGGTQLSGNSCMCQVGWSGTNCAQINCMNNATLVGSVCNCKAQYTGQFCEHALETCSNDELLYNTEVTSFIFVVDLQNLDLNDFKAFGNSPNDFPQMSEYILITYDGSNGETSDAEVLKTSNPDIFSKALQNMVTAPTNQAGKSNYYEYLEKGLNLQSGSRSVLVWMPNLFDCSIDQAPMASSVINLIQKKNADVRFISKSQYCPSFSNVILAGNGMVTDKYTDLSDLSSYLENVILLQQGTYLVVTDSNYMTGTLNCSHTQTITFPINGDANYYITLLGYTDASLTFSSQDTTQSLTPVMSNIIYTFSIDSSIPNSLTIKGNSSLHQCGYLIETSSSTRIAYTYKSIAFTGEKEYAPISNSLSTTLYFNVESDTSTSLSFLQAFPQASLQLIQDSTIVYSIEQPVIEVQRLDNCNYKFSFEFSCDNTKQNAQYKIQIKSSTNAYKKVIVGTCLSQGICVNGHLVNQICSCFEGWQGIDCSVPICQHGFIFNEQQCICDFSYYGSLCDQQYNKTTTKYETTTQIMTTSKPLASTLPSATTILDKSSIMTTLSTEQTTLFPSTFSPQLTTILSETTIPTISSQSTTIPTISAESTPIPTTSSQSTTAYPITALLSTIDSTTVLTTTLSTMSYLSTTTTSLEQTTDITPANHLDTTIKIETTTPNLESTTSFLSSTIPPEITTSLLSSTISSETTTPSSSTITSPETTLSSTTFESIKTTEPFSTTTFSMTTESVGITTISMTTESIPTTTDSMTTTNFMTTTESVPITTTNFITTTESVPITTTDFMTTTESVPITTTDSMTTTDFITTTDFMTTTESVPITTQYVPTTTIVSTTMLPPVITTIESSETSPMTTTTLASTSKPITTTTLASTSKPITTTTLTSTTELITMTTLSSTIIPSTTLASTIIPSTSTLSPLTTTLASTIIPSTTLASTIIPSTSTLSPSTSTLSPSTSTLSPSTTTLASTIITSTSTLPPPTTTLTSTILPSTSTLLPSTSTLPPPTTLASTIIPSTSTLSPSTTTLASTIIPSTSTLSPSTTLASTIIPSTSTLPPPTTLASTITPLSQTTTTLTPTTTIFASTPMPADCYKNLEINTILVFDVTMPSSDYINYFTYFMTNFTTKMDWGPSQKTRLAAIYASLSPRPIGYSTTDPNQYLKNLKIIDTNALIIDTLVEKGIRTFATTCNDGTMPCYKDKETFIIFFTSTDGIRKSISFDEEYYINSLKAIVNGSPLKHLLVVEFGNSLQTTSFWNTQFKSDVDSSYENPHGKLKYYDGSSIKNNLFQNIMMDVCVLNNN